VDYYVYIIYSQLKSRKYIENLIRTKQYLFVHEVK